MRSKERPVHLRKIGFRHPSWYLSPTQALLDLFPTLEGFFDIYLEENRHKFTYDGDLLMHWTSEDGRGGRVRNTATIHELVSPDVATQELSRISRLHPQSEFFLGPAFKIDHRLGIAEIKYLSGQLTTESGSPRYALWEIVNSDKDF